jgi:N-sulfoglucosamine sulfohydrolase
VCDTGYAGDRCGSCAEGYQRDAERNCVESGVGGSATGGGGSGAMAGSTGTGGGASGAMAGSTGTGGGASGAMAGSTGTGGGASGGTVGGTGPGTNGGTGGTVTTPPDPLYEGPPPNIVWLSTEDIRPYLTAYGDPTAHTPNIDRLAREGVVYTNVYAPAGVCAPSRSGIITGMYPTSIGTHNMRTGSLTPEGVPPYSAVLPPEVRCFTHYLRAAGYYCTNNGKTDYQFEVPIAAWDEANSSAHWRNRPASQVFCSVFNFVETHESKITDNASNPLTVDPAVVPIPPYYPDDPVVRQDLARNYSNVELLDAWVGDRLAELEQDGLLEQTIVFFWSDHGGPLPRQKREVYDSGLKVPLIVRFPNQAHASTVIEDLVSLIDFGPTMLSLAQVPIPAHIQGQAFLGEQVAPRRQYIYAARDRLDLEYDQVRAVGDGRFKYHRYYYPERPFIMNITYRLGKVPMMNRLIEMNAAGQLDAVQSLWFRQDKPTEELFDTWADPHEVIDLAADPTYAADLERLRAVLDAWQAEVGDLGLPTGSSPADDAEEERQLIRSMWGPDMIQPTTATPAASIGGDGMLTITCPTEGAILGYRYADQTAYNVYTGPFVPARSGQITIAAQRIGYQQSATLQVDAP